MQPLIDVSERVNWLTCQFLVVASWWTKAAVAYQRPWNVNEMLSVQCDLHFTHWWMWMVRLQVPPVECRQQHVMPKLAYIAWRTNKNRQQSDKNPFSMPSGAIWSTSFNRPHDWLWELSRGRLTLKARRGLEPFQNRFGRSLKCALLQNVFCKGCPEEIHYLWRLMAPSNRSWNHSQRLLWPKSSQTLILLIRRAT